MDWWHRLKETFRSTQPGSGLANFKDRAAPRVHAAIAALCSVEDEAAFVVDIRSLSITGLRLLSPQRIKAESRCVLRVPIGLRLQDRETTEYITFAVATVWSRRRPRSREYEVGVRYDEPCNDKRDRWLRLVMETYGFSMTSERRRGGERHPVHLPVTIRAATGGIGLEGKVTNLSLGGMRVQITDPPPPMDQVVGLEVGPLPGMDVLPLPARVINVLREKPTAPCHLGLEFETLTDEQKDRLLRLVYHLTREHQSSRD